jgi:hypothetical protein
VTTLIYKAVPGWFFSPFAIVSFLMHSQNLERGHKKKIDDFRHTYTHTILFYFLLTLQKASRPPCAGKASFRSSKKRETRNHLKKRKKTGTTWRSNRNKAQNGRAVSFLMIAIFAHDRFIGRAANAGPFFTIFQSAPNEDLPRKKEVCHTIVGPCSLLSAMDWLFVEKKVERDYSDSLVSRKSLHMQTGEDL